MVPIRLRRARARLRTVLIAVPFLASGAAFASLGSTQELPGVVATDLFEQAMQEQIVIPSVDDREQASVPRTLAWIVGLVAVALVIRGFRGRLVRFAGPAGSETTHTVPDAAPSVVSDVEEDGAGAYRPRKPSKPPEVLKLPPHVVAILETSAAARAAGRAALRPEPPARPRHQRHVDVTVPRYDPSRSEG